VESLFFATDNEINKKYKGALGGFRTWLTEGKTADLPAYLTSEVNF
jgi:soluble epoxide hydrolase/lipid-phosphate phosphatase